MARNSMRIASEPGHNLVFTGWKVAERENEIKKGDERKKRVVGGPAAVLPILPRSCVYSLPTRPGTPFP